MPDSPRDLEDIEDLSHEATLEESSGPIEIPRSTAPERPILIEAAQKKRFSSIFGSELAFVGRIVRRFGLPDDAVEDATQQVFIVLASKIDRVPVGAERSFLIGTAMRVCSGLRRSHRRRREASEPMKFDELSSVGPGPETHARIQAARRTLEVVLDAMPEDFRVVNDAVVELGAI